MSVVSEGELRRELLESGVGGWDSELGEVKEAESGKASSRMSRSMRVSCCICVWVSVFGGGTGDIGSGVLSVHKLPRMARLVPQNLGLLVLCLGSINGGDGGAF